MGVLDLTLIIRVKLAYKQATRQTYKCVDFHVRFRAINLPTKDSTKENDRKQDHHAHGKCLALPTTQML